jgi:exonuclease SbcC
VISFVEEPLASSGIFAIVGPTGSGKSTILDVITLALFNEVPRHGKLSKNAILDAGSIVTHHTKEAFASVEFEVKGKIFTSSWSIESTRTGNLKDYDMSISDAQGNFLDLRRSEVPAKNMELIGLNYDQFVKSIILSQGDFSRFLKARKEERSELLEKLTGSEIYRKISVEAFRKNKEIGLLLENEKSLLSEINLLTQEEISNTKNEIERREKTSTSLEAELEVLSQVKSIKENIKRLQLSVADKEQVVVQNSKDIEAFRSEDEVLNMHDKVKGYEAPLANYDQVRKSRDEIEMEITKYHKDKTAALVSLDATIAELSSLTKSRVSEDVFLNVISDFEKKVVDLDNALENLQIKGREIRSRLKNQIAGKKFDFSVDVDPAKGVKILEERKAKLQTELGGSELKLEGLRLDAKRISHNLTVLRNAHHVFLNVARQVEEQEKLGKALQSHTEKIVIAEPLIMKQLELLESLQSKGKLLQKQKEDAIKIAKLEHFRNQLVAGEPCPLCGALDHPYQEHIKESILSEIDEAMEETGILLNNQQEQLQKYQHDLSEAKTSVSIVKSRLEEIKQNLEQDRVELKKRKEQFLGGNAGPDEELEQNATALQVDLESKERQIEAIENLQIAQTLLDIFSELNEVAIRYKETKGVRQALYSGTNIKDKCNALRRDFVQSSTTISKLSEIIEKKRNDLHAAEERCKKLNEHFKEVLNNLGLDTIEQMKSFLLSSEKAKSLADKKIRLRDEKIKYTAELDQLKAELHAVKNKDDQKEVTIEEIINQLHEKKKVRDALNASVGELKSKIKFDQENRLAQGARQKKIAVLEEDLKKWSLLNKMIGSSKGDRFANFAQELTLNNLLVYANRRLKDLTDRYVFYMPKVGGTLGVVDIYQGNTERSVTTLSGGEIFILSLALALSLSDMASKNIALESLFIDEGFGTLDQETLDIAMTTLEKLQSESKKTVGIISHVEALKERINVQVRLEKNAQGYSKIKIVSS